MPQQQRRMQLPKQVQDPRVQAWVLSNPPDALRFHQAAAKYQQQLLATGQLQGRPCSSSCSCDAMSSSEQDMHKLAASVILDNPVPFMTPAAAAAAGSNSSDSTTEQQQALLDAQIQMQQLMMVSGLLLNGSICVG